MTALALEKVERQAEVATNVATASRAAFAIASMDPNTWSDLVAYRRDLEAAKKANDDRAVQYVVEAIIELFVNLNHGDMDNATALEDAFPGELSSSLGRDAITKSESQVERFQSKYFHFKAQSKLATQKDVATAAGISINTVQAIESDRRVRPHFKTVAALAKAFKIEIDDLIGNDI